MIHIVDYGLGNLASIRNMLHRIRIRSEITDDPKAVRTADRLILPGVGAFQRGMENIRSRGLFDALGEAVVARRVPILGICLGMQLLTRHSEEGDADGLGWIEADTVRFRLEDVDASLKVPHMGWRDVRATQSEPLFEGYERQPRFYFVHSYHVVCDEAADVAATAHYGHDVVCAVQRGNVLGVQFHPEKSHAFGMQMLRNFAAWNPV